ncbi:MAG: cupin domain-containing protein [Candidatus Heimdallarchaeota archaeon]
MIIGNYKDVKLETIDHLLPGTKGAKIRWLIGDDVGKNSLLRRYDFEPNATIPLHQHSHEHEMYILEGQGAVIGKDGEKTVGPGDFVYIESNEIHGFKNKSDTEPFVFLCIIPKERGSTSLYKLIEEK